MTCLNGVIQMYDLKSLKRLVLLCKKKVIYLFTFPSGRLKSILSPLTTDIFLCKTKICTTLRSGTSYFSFTLLFKIQPVFFQFNPKYTHTHTSTNRSGCCCCSLCCCQPFFVISTSMACADPGPIQSKKALCRVSGRGKTSNLTLTFVRSARTHKKGVFVCILGYGNQVPHQQRAASRAVCCMPRASRSRTDSTLTSVTLLLLLLLHSSSTLLTGWTVFSSHFASLPLPREGVSSPFFNIFHHSHRVPQASEMMAFLLLLLLLVCAIPKPTPLHQHLDLWCPGVLRHHTPGVCRDHH